MTEWIDVKDRLPEKGVDVLLYTPDDEFPEYRRYQFYVGRYVHIFEDGEIRFEYADGEYGVYGVTHWRLLPDAPVQT